MKRTMSLLLMSLIGLVGTLAWAGSVREDTVDRMQKSVDVLQSIMATPDKGIPEEVLNVSKCIVIVPNLVKGGFIFGAKHGRGVASAARLKAGALPHSSRLAVAVGDCRSESKVWTWSCWS